jgi:hypothetical protein
MNRKGIREDAGEEIAREEIQQMLRLLVEFLRAVTLFLSNTTVCRAKYIAFERFVGTLMWEAGLVVSTKSDRGKTRFICIEYSSSYTTGFD